jgi:hypothetical protein
VNADSALTAAAFPLHPGSQVSNIDSKLCRTLGLGRVSAHDPGHYVAGLEDASLEHISAVNNPLGRAEQRVAEGLPELAGRIA